MSSPYTPFSPSDITADLMLALIPDLTTYDYPVVAHLRSTGER